MEIRDIVEIWLKTNGYSGLFNGSADCACSLKDLMPCDCPCTDCEAGYLTEESGDDGEESFRVSRTKSETTEGGE